MANPRISATLLSQVLHGAERIPTPQQAEVTSAAPGPMLVVAGAGAGKTETMASRVVWMVANGLAKPEEVLGLTFTRKAAQELGQRIRTQFLILAGSPKIRDLDPTGELTEALTTVTPAVSTYDAYAGQLIREYGLLVPVEPDARLITQAELYALAYQVVTNYRGALATDNQVATITTKVLDFITEMDNQLAEAEDIAEASAHLAELIWELPKVGRQGVEPPQKLQGWAKRQHLRIQYLDLAKEVKAELSRQGLVTFNEQMSVAAKLARDQDVVRQSQRRRYRVVMLDEYQDTSHSQRVLLSHLFGTPPGSGYKFDDTLTITAVGDPMQAIYGWRGATVENLAEFVRDFPHGDTEAPKMELTMSWRNPAGVLTLANVVSEAVFDGAPRPVAELQPREGAGEGDIALGLFASEEEELDYVADQLAAEFRAAQDNDDSGGFTGAVLVRKNRHSGPMGQALEARGIPYEILGLGGLLSVPEVADVVALATMLVRPGDNAAALRILTGPLVGLGLADLQALQQRARNLSGAAGRVELPDDPVERLKAQLAEATAAPPDQVSGLADALADLGEPERYSPEGWQRLNQVASSLRRLRTYSLGKSLTDVFADVEREFTIRTEVLARGGSTGTAHLDRLADEVAAFHGDSVTALLDYFAVAREQEDGLEPGDVSVRSDRVQILTAHKAKGLEWDVVAVLHADQRTYNSKASTFLSNETKVPDEDIELWAAEDRKEFQDLADQYLEQQRQAEREELSRLFYVAITRTERRLLVTAHGEPYEHFQQLADASPEAVVHWDEEDDDSAPEVVPAQEAQFPALQAEKTLIDGAERVRVALGQLPALTQGETFNFWEREVDALIEEHRALQAPTIDVELPGELTASDVVAIKDNPTQFASRQRRPVPFKPNTYAKRGTAFHQWLEDRFGSRGLLDEDQLPGNDDEILGAEELAVLKDKFLASEWAKRTPVHVEQPFEVRIGDTVVRGRMDAIFQDSDGTWVIVDWKTGQRPTGPQLRAAEIQLAVYQEAWRRIVGAEATVSASFFYVSSNDTFTPRHLPDGDELAELLGTATGQEH